MTDRITTRHAVRDDLPGILELMRLSLGETPLLQRTPELFNWKHFDNPFGESLILIAEDGDQIVGLRAFMRWELDTPEGAVIKCLRAVDTATHPDFQGRGIFRDLTLNAVEAARGQGVHLIFNTPNEKSAPGYLKMGWREVGWIGPLIRPRAGRAISPDSDGRTTAQQVLPESVAFVPSFLKARSPKGLRTPRSVDYLKWRFLGHPTASYGWVGASTDEGAVIRGSVRKGRCEVLISELSGDEKVVRQVRRSHRARYVAASFTESTQEFRSARNGGLFAPPRVKGLRLVANRLDEVSVDVFDLSSWDLALSDLELL